jgi:hypothetical protein
MDYDDNSWLDELFPEQAEKPAEPAPERPEPEPEATPAPAPQAGGSAAPASDQAATADLEDAPDTTSGTAQVDEEIDAASAAPEPIVGDDELAEARDLERVLSEQRGLVPQIEEDEAATRRAGVREGDALEGLPLVALTVGGRGMRDGAPRVTQMSDLITQALREHVRAEVIRSRGVSEAAAENFAEKVSPTSLVMGFLIANLDVSLPVDQTTQLLVDLFRRRNPLLSNVALRVADMQTHALELEKRRDRQIDRLRAAEEKVLDVAHVVEQLTSFLVTDKWDASVVPPGTLPKDIPFTHKNVVETRDHVRRLVQTQREKERISEGRPIR